jgi:hypothetical protein
VDDSLNRYQSLASFLQRAFCTRPPRHPRLRRQDGLRAGGIATSHSVARGRPLG